MQDPPESEGVPFFAEQLKKTNAQSFPKYAYSLSLLLCPSPCLPILLLNIKIKTPPPKGQWFCPLLHLGPHPDLWQLPLLLSLSGSVEVHLGSSRTE